MITLPAIWREETQQSLWRSILNATGFPGRAQDLTLDLDGSPAWLGVLATLADHTQGVCDLHQLLAEEDWNLLGAQRADFDQASFTLADSAVPPVADQRPTLGTVYRPELGATLVLRVGAIGTGSMRLMLKGPGINDSIAVALDGIDPGWIIERAKWCADFPLGIDMLLCDATQVFSLPRTTTIEIGG